MKYLLFFIISILVIVAAFLLLRQPTEDYTEVEPASEQPQAVSANPTTPPTNESSTSTIASVKPVKPYTPPIVRDSKLAVLVNRNGQDRVTPDMATRFPEAKPEDFSALLAVVADTQDNDTARHEVVELLKRSKCPDLTDTLWKVLGNPEEGPRFRSFAMQHIGFLAQALPDSDAKDTQVTKMREALADKHFQVRSQALQNLCRLKDQTGIQTAVKWLDYANYTPAPAAQSDAKATATGKQADPDFERGYMLNQAIRCVHELGLKEHIPAIRKYSRDSNEVVRIAALVALSAWKDAESLPAMQEAAAAKSPRLARCGQDALKRMETQAAN